MKNRDLCFIGISVIILILSGCMTLSKIDVNVISRDLNNMSLPEKLENCSWILSQYPDHSQIREKRALIFFELGLFSFSLDDCGYLIEHDAASDRIIEIFNLLNGKEVELDETKWIKVYDSYEQGYSNYFKGLFHIQAGVDETALQDFLLAVKNLPKSFFKFDSYELIGDFYDKNHNYNDAISFYCKANSIYSNSIDLHIKMFDIYLKQNNIDQAKKELKIIKNLTGDNILYENAIKKLEI